MPYRKVGLALILATLIVFLVSLSPVVPVLESTSVVRTQMRRVDHERRADFAAGQFDGGLVLAGDADSPALTLSWPGEGSYTSPAVHLDLTASSLAAHWTLSRAPETDVAFALRTSPEGVVWSPWYEIEGEGGSALGDREKVFSTLAFVDGAHYAQYRITLSAAGPGLPSVSAVSLFAIDSTSSTPTAEVRLQLVPKGAALAAIKPVGIVSRKQWGADESLRFAAAAGPDREDIWPEEVQDVEKIVIHHTAGPNVCSSIEEYCQRQSVAAINDIYYYHSVVNGWGDIGYNSLIGYDGRIYEGRHGPGPVDGEPLEQPVVAGHALGYNQRTHGVALMGNYENEPVPDLEYDALEKLVSWLVKSKLAAGGEIDPLAFSGYRLTDGSSRPALPNIIGHRDVNDTECPGEFLYQRISHLRERIQRLIEWPPVNVELRAQPENDAISYRILVDNHEPELVKRLTVKGVVPPNAEYVDSWAGSPGQNRGNFDGSVVTWVDPDGKLSPGQDRREYVFAVRPRPGASRIDVRATAWVEFAEPAPGIAMSETASADGPIEAIAHRVAGGRVAWEGDWPVSRNVNGYYGDSYQVHSAGDGTATYTWEVDLIEAGQFEVFGWWTSAADRSTNAPYTVYARDGAHPVRVSQQSQGARWVSLGTYYFDKGPGRVRLSDDADGVVIADAVRFREKR
ncbi:MAG: N-acetylmuramoyl-L-alanine amidase [Chloroflexi bacterium]|nr:N-acetylmuramoyl-L-alanine amidase [Chloroflexota bacterium]